MLSPGRQLIADNSILNLNSNMGMYSNENLPSRRNLDSPPHNSKTDVKPRKVFGANDYLERQERIRAGKQEERAPAAEEDFAEMHARIGSQVGSVNKLY